MASQPKTAREKPPATAKGLIGQFKSAKRCGTPLIAIQTPDQFATVARIAGELNGKTPIVRWDVINGFLAVNDLGQAAKNKIDADDASQGAFFVACKLARNAPPASGTSGKEDWVGGTVLFMLNAQRHLDDPLQVQSVCNLRDHFKAIGCNLVLMAPQITLPQELQSDVVVLDEPLPGPEELRKIVNEMYDSAEIEKAPETVLRAVDAIQGLPAFAAEQVTAMSMTPQGLDIDALWERKRKQVEQTPGLIVDRFTQTFADIGGLGQVCKFGQKLFNGPRRPNVVCRIEEIEKVMAGASGDTSGVSQDALQVILNNMEDNDWSGIIAFGPPGSGKSLFSKALAATFGAFSLGLDLGAARGSLVGESEAAIRTAMKVIKSIGGSQVFFVATANRLETMPAELRRRFRYGVWFFDSPDSAERSVIWKLSKERYGIPSGDKLSNDEGLTGADIRNICELSMSLRCKLDEASEFIAPICKTSPQTFEDARKIADGKFLSASYPGLYKRDYKMPAPAQAPGRRMQMGE